MCCTWLTGNAAPKKLPKSRHLGPITQLCQAISSQLRHVSTVGKKLVKHQYLSHVPSQYGELRPTSGWDLLTSLGHPCKFQRVSRLGSVTARHSSSGRQPNFVALNTGRHLYSAGRPSRWALAHISSLFLQLEELNLSTKSPFVPRNKYCKNQEWCWHILWYWSSAWRRQPVWWRLNLRRFPHWYILGNIAGTRPLYLQSLCMPFGIDCKQQRLWYWLRLWYSRIYAERGVKLQLTNSDTDWSGWEK